MAIRYVPYILRRSDKLMFIHDIIKMEYVRQGYLPNFPYHLISDQEMFDAFIVFEIVVSESQAKRIQQGNTSLWEAPKQFVTQYKLQSFEYIEPELLGEESHVLIRGGQESITIFNDLCSINNDIRLSDACYFSANYSMTYDSLQTDYHQLIDAICYHISTYLKSVNAVEVTTIPDWVYSYMLGSVIGNK